MRRRYEDIGSACGPGIRGPLPRALAKIASGEPAHLVTELSSGSMRLASEKPEDAGSFTQQISGMGTAYVFGGGHVAQALVPLLARAEFPVVVLDDRPEFASAALFRTPPSVWWILSGWKACGSMPMTASSSDPRAFV